MNLIIGRFNPRHRFRGIPISIQKLFNLTLSYSRTQSRYSSITRVTNTKFTCTECISTPCVQFPVVRECVSIPKPTSERGFDRFYCSTYRGIRKREVCGTPYFRGIRTRIFNVNVGRRTDFVGVRAVLECRRGWGNITYNYFVIVRINIFWCYRRLCCIKI